MLPERFALTSIRALSTFYYSYLFTQSTCPFRLEATAERKLPAPAHRTHSGRTVQNGGAHNPFYRKARPSAYKDGK